MDTVGSKTLDGYSTTQLGGGWNMSGSFNKGVRNGLWTTSSDKYDLQSQMPYENGVIHGVCNTYHPGSKLFYCRRSWQQYTCVWGKKNGMYKEWSPKGKLFIECFYLDDQLDGEYKEWHENGQMSEHCSYHRGEKNGKYTSWREDGSKIRSTTYKNGEEVEEAE